MTASAHAELERLACELHEAIYVPTARALDLVAEYMVAKGEAQRMVAIADQRQAALRDLIVAASIVYEGQASTEAEWAALGATIARATAVAQ